MEYSIEKECFTFDILTEIKPTCISSVACVKGFLKPLESDKSNKEHIKKLETKIEEIVNEYVENSSVFSGEYITDFECTKNSLTPNKWSRWKIDLYLKSKHIENHEEVVQETFVLCEKIGKIITESKKELFDFRNVC